MKNFNKDQFDVTEADIEQNLLAAASSGNADVVEIAVGDAYTHGLVRSQVSAFLKLLVIPWHHQHENIASALQKLKDPISADTLFHAATVQHDYLDYDESFALAKKCAWALADIGTSEAQKFLQVLSTNENEIIAAHAQKRLDCWDEERDRKSLKG